MLCYVGLVWFFSSVLVCGASSDTNLRKKESVGCGCVWLSFEICGIRSLVNKCLALNISISPN